MTLASDVEVAWARYKILHELIFEGVILLILCLVFIGAIEFEVDLSEFFFDFGRMLSMDHRIFIHRKKLFNFNPLNYVYQSSLLLSSGPSLNKAKA